MNCLQEIIKSKLINYFKNSWCYLETELIKILEELIRKLLDLKKSNCNKNFKNVGCYSLNQNSIKKYDASLKLTSNYFMLKLIESITGINLNISCFINMLNEGKTDCLKWHSEIYLRNKQILGPFHKF